MNMSQQHCELTIVMPCLNEAETLGICIDKANNFLLAQGIEGEVVIADNGSTDGSQEIAREKGSRVIDVKVKGYGAALLAGITAANGKFIIMGDSDDSYDFSRLEEFIIKLREGYELVIGNRFKGGIDSGAMPWLHKYVGNPVLSLIGRLFYGSPVGDFHCGLRGINKKSIMNLKLCTTGMEFASEMVVKATINKLRITEVSTTLSKDGRTRPPHLRSWSDGWRHLRFLLMYSPRWLFLYPGIALLIIGLAINLVLLSGPVTIGATTFDVHSMIIAAAALMMGTQTLTFALLARQFCVNEGLLPPSSIYKTIRKAISLEKTLVVGAILVILGSAGIIAAVIKWGAIGFSDLDYSVMMRILIPATTVLVIGFQIILAGFLSSILDLGFNRSSNKCT